MTTTGPTLDLDKIEDSALRLGGCGQDTALALVAEVRRLRKIEDEVRSLPAVAVLLDSLEVPRCQHVSPSPWGPTQCCLPLDHDDRHAYDPSES